VLFECGSDGLCVFLVDNVVEEPHRREVAGEAEIVQPEEGQVGEENHLGELRYHEARHRHPQPEPAIQ